MIDYHLHTPLCNHAKGVMEAYVQRAVAIGLKEICFLDHLTIRNIDNSGNAIGHELSMSPGEVPFYFQAVQHLKQRYTGVINIKVGLETDFNPAAIGHIQEIAGRYSFDVIGTSLHFVADMNIASSASEWNHGKWDSDYIYGLYLQQLEKMLDYNYFDVICHLDMIKKFGHKSLQSFDKELDALLSKIKDKNLVVEVNTSGYNHPANEIYPCPDIVKKCQEAGIAVTLGSDAHTPESVGQHFDRALPLLVAAGYKQLTTFTKRRRGTVSIDELSPPAT